MSATGPDWLPWLDEAAAAWEFLRTKLAGARESAEEWGSLARVGRPIEPFDAPGVLGAIVGLAAALAGLVLVGAALVSLVSLLASLLGLGFLLTRVFGISVELDAPAAR